MPEDLPVELQGDAAGFAAALPASVIMPAGAGKTHLLAATAKHIVEQGGKALVLTHTNAGVSAINGRLQRFGVTQGVQVSTITSFAFRLARSYPVLGQKAVPKVMILEDSRAYVEAATKVISGQHIKAVLAASFTHLLVDEYQDCSEEHHEFVLKLKDSIPNTGILGDPMQAIFGFSDRLPLWDDVLTDFPEHKAIDPLPRRWAGHNEELGAWLFNIRPNLKPGATLPLDHNRFPNGVTFTNISGQPQGVRAAGLTALKLPPEETVLIISARHRQAGRTIAEGLKGTYTVMEEIAGGFMVEALRALGECAPAQFAWWLFNFTKECHCGHGVLDPKPLGKRYLESRTGGDLLQISDKREGARVVIEALDRVVNKPTLSELATAMDVIPSSQTLQLHSHEAWWDVKAAIRGAVASDSSQEALLRELAKARDMLRHAGRRERRRIISRTTLVKGLEYDHVIIADAANHLEVHDLYVALTRARKTVHILATTDIITLVASPNGPKPKADRRK